MGVTDVTGNARLADVLIRCGLERAAAVVCVETDELISLEIALLVPDLRAGVRVVVQLVNAAVGQAVADVTGPGSVLDTAMEPSTTITRASTASRSPWSSSSSTLVAVDPIRSMRRRQDRVVVAAD